MMVILVEYQYVDYVMMVMVLLDCLVLMLYHLVNLFVVVVDDVHVLLQLVRVKESHDFGLNFHRYFYLHFLIFLVDDILHDGF
jgi:hypothetical protein